jgi:hypothetical protein
MKRKTLKEEARDFEVNSGSKHTEYALYYKDVKLKFDIKNEQVKNLKCGNLEARTIVREKMGTATKLEDSEETRTIYDTSREIMSHAIKNEGYDILYFNILPKKFEFIIIAAGEVANETDMHEVKRGGSSPDTTYALARKDLDEDYVEEIYDAFFIGYSSFGSEESRKNKRKKLKNK